MFCRNATKLSTTEESLREGLLLDRMRPRKSESRGERADFWGALYALSCSMAMVVMDANVYRARVRWKDGRNSYASLTFVLRPWVFGPQLPSILKDSPTVKSSSGFLLTFVPVSQYLALDLQSSRPRLSFTPCHLAH